MIETLALATLVLAASSSEGSETRTASETEYDPAFLQQRREEVQRAILERMVRTLWVNSWADAEEEACRSHAGEELFDSAPDNDEYKEEFQELAETIYRDIQKGWKKDPAIVLLENEKYAGWDLDTLISEWGYYAAMEVLGHGVCWTDDHELLRTGFSPMETLIGKARVLPRVGDLHLYHENISIQPPGPERSWIDDPNKAWDALAGPSSDPIDFLDEWGEDYKEELEEFVRLVDKNLGLEFDDEGIEDTVKILSKTLDAALKAWKEKKKEEFEDEEDKEEFEEEEP
jgi:hypothetical protein